MAAAFLSERGYRVVARNQRTPLGELDLVCRYRSEMVIVEVKARSSEDYGTGLEAIGPRKAARLRGAAMWWLSAQGLLPCLLRFDAVVVTLDHQGLPTNLQHLSNILET